MVEGAVWIVAVADEVAIRTALTTTDMGTAAHMANHKLRHHMSRRILLNLERHTLKGPSKDSGAMVPMEGHQFKIMVTILARRAVVHPLEEAPLPRAECHRTAVALPVAALPVAALLVVVVPGMEVLRPMLKPLINQHMVVEVTLVGTVAAVGDMVGRRIMVTVAMEATVARQAEVVMVVQEDKTIVAATWVMETRMGDKLVVAMEAATMEEVIRTLQEAGAEDSRITYMHTAFR
jgi:hypothetical protein